MVDLARSPPARQGKDEQRLRYEVNPPTQLFGIAPFLFLLRSWDSVSRWRFGRLVCVWRLFAVANLCLCLIIVFENKFSAIISQTQQSSIVTPPLRSPLNCCDRSNPMEEKEG